MPRWDQGWEAGAGRLGLPGGAWRGRGRVPDALCLADPTEEEDEAQLKPPDGVPRGLGDGLAGAQAPNRLYQVLEIGSSMTPWLLKQERKGAGEGRERAAFGLAGRSPVRLQTGLDLLCSSWRDLREI